MPPPIARPSRLARRKESNISGNSVTSSTSRSGAGGVSGGSLVMRVDDQAAVFVVKRAHVLLDHREKALDAVFSGDRHHVLGAVPERAADPPEFLAVGTEDFVPDDVLHVEFGRRKRGK